KKIFALYGEMGAGKSTLVKSFCKALCVKEESVSPTFSLVNEYCINESVVKTPTTTVFHFDLYRLKNAEELIDIGFEEYLSRDGYCFIEWPELAEPFLPSSSVKVKLEWSGTENFRTVKIN